MRILPFILLVSMLASDSYSQSERKAMGVIDFLNLPVVSDPVLSPDAYEMLYIYSESDWEANRQIGHIWLRALDDSEERQMTYGEDGESNPGWSPDGKWISFTAKRNEDDHNQIYVMRSDGGEAFRLTDHATAVSNYQWSPDGRYIYFTASDTLSKAEETAKKDKDDVYRYDENFQHRHLWRISFHTREEAQLSAGEFSILNYHLSADGQKIVFQKGVNPLLDFSSQSEVWLMNANGTESIQITHNEIAESNTRLSPDGTQILFTAFANENMGLYYNDKIFLVPADGTTVPSAILSDRPWEVTSAEWSSDGRSIYFLANMGTEEQLWQYYLNSAQAVQLSSGPQSLGSWYFDAERGMHLFTVSTAENPGDIHLLEGFEFRQLTHRFDSLQYQFELPRQEAIRWRGADGVEVEGLLHYPFNYDSEKKYPLVVQTHGGPAASDQFGLSRGITRYVPVLTGKGYIVLQPNYRGSTGYGDDFLRDMVGGYFRQSHLDVMAGVDYLLEKGIADPDKLIKMGWSAGGHMTNKIITFTDRFKAASSGAGAVNWAGMYAQSDIRIYRTPWFGGTPWQKDAPIDVYWDNSPLKDIHKVTTPTLVFVGENDPRVPLPQSLELYRALRSNGVPTHLYVAPREPHGWRELRHRLLKINAELDWFAKYALKQEYEWETVPE